MTNSRKKTSVRDIEVVAPRDGDEGTWLKDALHREGARRYAESERRKKKERAKGGTVTGALKKARALTDDQIAAAKAKICAAGQRPTYKRIAKALGKLSPEYIRKRMRKMRT